jgi:hypothetical protein
MGSSSSSCNGAGLGLGGRNERGEKMKLRFADVCLLVIAVCCVIALFKGWNAF